MTKMPALKDFKFTCNFFKEADILGCTNHYSSEVEKPGFDYNTVSKEYKYCIAEKTSAGRTPDEQYKDMVILCAKSEKELFQFDPSLNEVMKSCYPQGGTDSSN